MKISMLVWNLSANSIVRTYPLAKVLARKHEVEIIGPVFGNGIFEPYKDEFEYKSFKASPYIWSDTVDRIADLVTGDVIYAFKTAPTSFGAGLIAKGKKDIPLILDIEDLDTAVLEYGNIFGKMSQYLSAHRLDSRIHFKRYERRVSEADKVTVVSEFLKERFGGTKIYHGSDTDVFDPKKFDRETERARYGLKHEKVILFSGTVHPHKGIDVLAEAIKSIGRDDIVLLIAGPENAHLARLLSLPFIRYVGMVAHNDIGGLLSAADIVCLPQLDTPGARAQVPAKVFEAMAMEKPVITSAVGELPKILEGWGKAVKAGDVEGLAEMIKAVLADDEMAKKRGKLARKKCIENYSWDAMEDILAGIFTDL